eukprot:Lankesteria_metandrocarpae@DN1739_c0_g1_i2.p3
MTLCVLPSFRRYGIGTDLLRWVLSKAASNATLDEVYLHVWKGNPAAVQIYKGEGFEEVGEEELYKYLKPATAVKCESCCCSSCPLIVEFGNRFVPLVLIHMFVHLVVPLHTHKHLFIQSPCSYWKNFGGPL